MTLALLLESLVKAMFLLIDFSRIFQISRFFNDRYLIVDK